MRRNDEKSRLECTYAGREVALSWSSAIIVDIPQRIAEAPQLYRLSSDDRVSLEHTPVSELMSASPITPHPDKHRGALAAVYSCASNLNGMSWKSPKERCVIQFFNHPTSRPNFEPYESPTTDRTKFVDFNLCQLNDHKNGASRGRLITARGKIYSPWLTYAHNVSRRPNPYTNSIVVSRWAWYSQFDVLNLINMNSTHAIPVKSRTC